MESFVFKFLAVNAFAAASVSVCEVTALDHELLNDCR